MAVTITRVIRLKHKRGGGGEGGDVHTVRLYHIQDKLDLLVDFEELETPG